MSNKFKIIDSHSHYDDESFNEDREEVLNQITSNGVIGILNCASSYESLKATDELTKKYDYIYGALGIHPENANEMNDDVLKEIKSYIKENSKIIAIGEIGLDYYWDENPSKEIQKEVFIGESGCGKSMMALSIMGLVPIPPGRIAGGEILYCGTDLLTLEKDAILDIRGKRIAMIFQEPMNSLNPVFTVGNQLVETLLRHEDMTRRDAWDKSVDMLKAVGIPSPEKRMHDYSFQMSGGMRQRVMIAMSLCLDPDILIADEPTTALDVTVQAQILDLLREMQDRVGASIIMITHDLGVVAEVSDKVAVMYAGRKVEEGSVEQILFNPQHPYTKALKGCIPHLQRTPTSGRHRLHEIPGMVLGMAELGKDRCSFYERCPCGKPECMEHNPPAKAIDAGHEVACWLYS